MYYCLAIERQHTINATLLLHPHGLHHREWRVLAILNEHDGRTVGHIAELAGIERSTMSKMIDALVARTLVVRTSEAADRRRSLVYLTRAGRAKYAETVPIVQGLIYGYFEGYPDAEFAALMTLLRDLKRRVMRPDLRAAAKINRAARRNAPPGRRSAVDDK